MSDRSLLKGDGSINQNAAARAFGIKQPTLHRILSGESQDPKARIVESIATYFDVEPAHLRGEKPLSILKDQASISQEKLTKDELLLLSLFRSLPPALQRLTIRIVAAMKS